MLRASHKLAEFATRRTDVENSKIEIKIESKRAFTSKSNEFSGDDMRTKLFFAQIRSNSHDVDQNKN